MPKPNKTFATRSCVYVKRPADVDAKALKALTKGSLALTRKTWPKWPRARAFPLVHMRT